MRDRARELALGVGERDAGERGGELRGQQGRIPSGIPRMALDIIVLAAGLGKRMRSDLPKVLHPLAGRPLLAHVLDAARALAPKSIIVVHGHGAERVRAAFPDKSISWALQAEQLGTGHAVMQALPQLAGGGGRRSSTATCRSSDPATLERLRAAARGGLALLTVELPDPKGYGRDRARRRQGGAHRRGEGRIGRRRRRSAR